jgi:hypothetical protein
MGSINVYFFQLLSSFIITSHCTLLSIKGILQLRLSTCYVIYRLFLKQKIIKRNITKRDFFVFFVVTSLQEKKYLIRILRLFAVIQANFTVLQENTFVSLTVIARAVWKNCPTANFWYVRMVIYRGSVRRVIDIVLNGLCVSIRDSGCCCGCGCGCGCGSVSVR